MATLPLTRRLPDWGWSCPAMSLSKVVLPTPLRPTSPVRSTAKFRLSFEKRIRPSGVDHEILVSVIEGMDMGLPEGKARRRCCQVQIQDCFLRTAVEIEIVGVAPPAFKRRNAVFHQGLFAFPARSRNRSHSPRVRGYLLESHVVSAPAASPCNKNDRLSFSGGRVPRLMVRFLYRLDFSRAC